MKTIRAKIVLLAASAAILVAASLTVSFWFVLKSSSDAQLASLEALLNADFDRLIKTQIESAASMLAGLAKQRDAGHLSAGEARELARDLLRGMKFGADGYFWADTPQGDNQVLLGSATEGTNRMNLKDAKGFELVKAIIAAGMAGGQPAGQRHTAQCVAVRGALRHERGDRRAGKHGGGYGGRTGGAVAEASGGNSVFQADLRRGVIDVYVRSPAFAPINVGFSLNYRRRVA